MAIEVKNDFDQTNFIPEKKMIRHSVLVLAALFSLGPFALAQQAPKSAPANAPTISVPGTWLLAYDWGCTGSYGTTTMTLNSNGTWTSSQGYSGTWVLVSGASSGTTAAAGQFTFNFNTAKTTYMGTLASKSITGIQTTFGGSNGCFYMRQSGAPTLSSEDNLDQPAKDKPQDSSGNR